MNTREGKNEIKNVNRRQKKKAVKPAKYTAIWCPVNARGKGSCLRPECPKGKGTKKKTITTRASQEEEQEDMPSCCLLPGDAKNRRTSHINIQQIHE